ncbi:MAG: CAP domain-containing protein [Gaiellaceae bacterium]
MFRPTGALRLAWRAFAFAGLAAVAIALAPASGTVAQPSVAVAAGVGDCNPDAAWPANRQDYADQVVALVNQHRASLGLVQLKVSPTLAAAAVWKARHMAYYRYMAHDDPAPPVARTWFQRVQACGYAGYGAGENIAYGYTSPQAVMNAWLNSPGHRANIENASYRVIGVGVAGSTIYWSQEFGTTDDSGGGAPPPAGDGTAPSVPGLLTATSPSSSQVALTWGASTDNVGVTGYRVYRGGVQVATTATTTYTDGGLAASTPYSYTVRAYDGAGNLGAPSNAATVTTQSASTPPPPPPPPPPTGGTTVYANSYALQSGSTAGGFVSALRSQDGYTLNTASSAGGTAAWYARFTMPRTLSSLTASYAGTSTQLCTRTLSVYDWSTYTWQTLSTGTAGAATSALTLPLAGPFGRYLGGSSTNGEVRIRVSCSRTDAVPFTVRTDRLTLAYG